jgi:hypothetical protein
VITSEKKRSLGKKVKEKETYCGMRKKEKKTNKKNETGAFLYFLPLIFRVP